MAYNWPGNVRELSNFCERLSVLSDSETADTHAVRISLEHPVFEIPSQKLETSLADISELQEREAIRTALTKQPQTGGRQHAC